MPKSGKSETSNEQSNEWATHLDTLHLINQHFFRQKETFLAEAETEFQKATIDWIEYLDPETQDKNSKPETTNDEIRTITAGVLDF